MMLAGEGGRDWDSGQDELFICRYICVLSRDFQGSFFLQFIYFALVLLVHACRE